MTYRYQLHYSFWNPDTQEHRQAMVQAWADRLRNVVPASALAPSLDIGCGMGFCLQALQALGFADVTGIDADQEQVEICTRQGLRVHCLSDVVSFLEDKASHYGVILMIDVLEHLPPAEHIAVLTAVRRSLRPGGRVILQVPNANSVIACRWRYNDITHTTSFTEHSLRFVILNAGFAKLNIVPDASRRFRLRPWRLSDWRALPSRFRRWFVAWCWRQVQQAELSQQDLAQNLPLDPNLFAWAEA